jgi:hypothetical protein
MASPAKMGVLVRGLVDCDARPCRAPEYGPQPDRLTAQLRHCSRNKLQGFTQAFLPSGPHRGAPDRQKAAVLVVRRGTVIATWNRSVRGRIITSAPLDPECPKVANFMSCLFDDPMTEEMGAPTDDIVEGFERRHRTTCRRCQQYGAANIEVTS